MAVIDRVRAVPLRGPGLILLTAAALGAVLGYAFWFVSARLVSVEVIGELSALISAVGLVALLASAGLAAAGTVSFTRADHATRARLLTAMLAGSAIAALTLAAVGWALAGSIAPLSALQHSPALAGVFALACLVTTWALLLDLLVNAVHRPGWALARSATQGTVRLVLLAGLALAGTTAWGITAGLGIWAIAGLAAVAIPFVGMTRTVGLSTRVDLTTLRELVRGAHWQQVVTVAAQLPAFALPIIVVATVGAAQGAGFYLAWQLAAGCFMAQAAVTPTLLVSSAANHAGADVALRQALRTLAVLLVPLMAATALLGPLVLSFLGPQYADAAAVLWVLVLVAPADAVKGVFVARWRSLGAEQSASMLNVSAMVATLALAAMFTLWLGPVGAAVAFGIVQVVSAAVVFVVDRRVVAATQPSR